MQRNASSRLERRLPTFDLATSLLVGPQKRLRVDGTPFESSSRIEPTQRKRTVARCHSLGGKQTFSGRTIVFTLLSLNTMVSFNKKAKTFLNNVLQDAHFYY